MNCEFITNIIVNWLKSELKKSNQNGFVIGVSGGIDSAVTSTLAAKTEYPIHVMNMPILQEESQFARAREQTNWLEKKYKNVSSSKIDLTETFKVFSSSFGKLKLEEIALVNSRSRLRMISLYVLANTYNYLVCGTGNKVEDYGIGFFTKYGDGGVDLSPIGDLLKSEVYELGDYLGIPQSILTATPTDGLWGEDRTDEDQIGASYDELEWAMNYCDENNLFSIDEINEINDLNSRQKVILKIYALRHTNNLHKMQMPPVCDLSTFLKSE